MIRKLPTSFVEKIWGVARLPEPFPHPIEGKVGEIWFEPPPELDSLLVKYIFTSENLSVQCHPDDLQASKMGLARGGKSECWAILNARPGAKIAVGFENELSPERMQAAAMDGSIVEYLTWHDVEAGDVFYIPAGIVHAIGAGIELIEVQQNSNISFRLFDYGRPRELHLEEGMRVADTGPYPQRHRVRIDGDGGDLVRSPHFVLKHWRIGGAIPFPSLGDMPALIMPFDGHLAVGSETIGVGDCALCQGLSADSLGGEGVVLIAQARQPR